MTSRSTDRPSEVGGATPPQLEFLYEVQFWPQRSPVDLGNVSGHHRLLTDLSGHRVEGPRIHGRILPGSVLVQTIFQNGIQEAQSKIGIELDDGHQLFGEFTGVCSIKPEHAWELAQGRAFDPEGIYLRSCGRLEAADDSPYSWLNRSILVAKSTQIYEATVWRLL